MRNKIKIIDSIWIFFLATAILGPFALPLLWRNPRWSFSAKALGTALIVFLTILLIYATYRLKDLANGLHLEVSP